MNRDALRERLAERSVAGRWTAFTTGGTILAALGLALFVLSLMGEDPTRAWQVFHVNWIFWTGIAGGSIALTAVHKIANALKALRSCCERSFSAFIGVLR
jgi:hypothetical protein